MERNYSLDDVETLRRKAGISYEEAVRLLDKYDGSIAQALVELEKSGKMDGAQAIPQVNVDRIGEWLKAMWRKGLAMRLLITRKGENLVNLSVLTVLALIVLGHYASVFALAVMLITGCRVSIKRETPEAEQADDFSDADVSADAGEAAQGAQDEAQDEDKFDNITIE